MDYNEREKLKDASWKAIGEEKCPERKANLLINGVMTAHYHRAREDIQNRRNRKSCLKKIAGSLYSPEYVLDIDLYARHWLAAMEEYGITDKDTWIELLKWYTPQQSKYLPKGYTIYRDLDK